MTAASTSQGTAHTNTLTNHWHVMDKSQITRAPQAVDVLKKGLKIQLVENHAVIV